MGSACSKHGNLKITCKIPLENTEKDKNSMELRQTWGKCYVVERVWKVFIGPE